MFARWRLYRGFWIAKMKYWKVQNLKVTARLKMCSNRWQLISQVLFLWREPLLLCSTVISAVSAPRLGEHSSPPPPRAELECEKPSFIYWAINLQQYLEGFLHFHDQQDLFPSFSKWLCCYRLFNESLSHPLGWSRQFQQLCFPFGTVLNSRARWWLIKTQGVLIPGGIYNYQAKKEKENKKQQYDSEFQCQWESVIMSH